MKQSGAPTAPALPGWFKTWRIIAVLIALLYLSTGILLPLGEASDAMEIVSAAVTLLLWLSPWVWVRWSWLWWPLYLLSASISFYMVRASVGTWVIQYYRPTLPFIEWTPRMQTLTLFSTIVAAWSVWQTVALLLARVRGFHGKHRIDLKRAYFRGGV